MPFTVTPGGQIEQKMLALGDEPASSEQVTEDYSEAYGKSGRQYVHLKLTDTVHTYTEGLLVPPLPEIVQVGSPNFWEGRNGHQPIAIVIHTMDGFLGGSDSHFNNPATEVSAHFGVGLNGEIHQYVDMNDSAWANGIPDSGNIWNGTPGVNPNRETLSIETEDLHDGSTPVSDEQFNSVLALAQMMMETFPTIDRLVRHTAISPINKPDCPGDRWVASGRFGDLADALGLTTL